ncbi:MAG: anhydro-N-acetylmuramic acid kinase [Alphaproteobacteria bacterium]|nr:anhydro-N-acetylmuramic acid kinase [Alphaproteobacteria bacterium]
MEPIKAIGMMSGTSMDGIDVALLVTDGEAFVRPGPSRGYPYEADLRAQLKGAMRLARELAPGDPVPAEIAAAERELTLAHGGAVAMFFHQVGGPASGTRLLGFHGQTIFHAPERGRTWQLGDGPLLAQVTGFDTVHDFRTADVAAGGQGAPFVPLYHAALVARLRVRGLMGPVAVLNLGGVGNLTYVGPDGAIMAFDTGPANGPIDDWIEAHTGQRMDADGAVAAKGRVHEELVLAALDHPFFDLAPPKSLDRGDFPADLARGLSLEDGAATLTAFSAASVAAARDFLPEAPDLWIACGGGRRNPSLLAALRTRLGVPVLACEEVGWDGDAIEAQAFAYLAVRSLRGLPLSLPETTGVVRPMPGGRLAKARP